MWQGGGAAGLARHLFEEVSRSQPSLRIGAVNTETNAKQQSQNRAMMEGGDLNDWLGNTLDITDRICGHALQGRTNGVRGVANPTCDGLSVVVGLSVPF